MKMWAVLEIHHDSEKGPTNVDFAHAITLHAAQTGAFAYVRRRADEIRSSPLAKANELEFDDGFELTFASDDWWKFEVHEVEVPQCEAAN